nr:Xaa-Pro peptidase family protein [Corynebacterium tuscaniense]
MLDTYARRIGTLQKRIADSGLSGAIIGAGAELAYLTGSWSTSHERLTALVVPPVGYARLFAPATDASAVAEVGDIPGVVVETWRDGNEPYDRIADVLADRPVALGSSLTADHVLRLQMAGEIGETVLANDVLSDVFAVKEPEEIAELEKAAHAIDAVHAAVPDLLVAGSTERDVADEIAQLILKEHATVDFVIVGSGPNGANPHHDFSDRVLQSGEPVVVDIGGSLASGYHSDCTRTYAVESMPDRAVLAAYEELRAAQLEALSTARPGMTAGELDAVARGRINQAGYGVNFSHRLGHGIGLALHEPPFLVSGSDTVLQEGMVFSIEPGIYVDGQWGMRIEDIVVLEANGARPLNLAPKNLLGESH